MKGYSLKRIIAVLAVLVLSVTACLFTVSFNAEADGEIVLSGVKKTQTIDVTDEVK